MAEPRNWSSKPTYLNDSTPPAANELDWPGVAACAEAPAPAGEPAVLSIEAAPFDLVALVRDLSTTLTTHVNPVEVKTPLETLIVEGDPARLRQCLENLIANGVQHTPDGTPVTVMLSTQHKKEGDRAVIEVIDEGPGVSPELLPHIFDRYVSGKRASGGLGLGLYIARRVVELHGGELRVERRTPIGSRFIVSLPLP